MGAADRDHPPDPRRVQGGELQAYQRAVGTADEGIQGFDAQRVEHRHDRIGLVGRIDRRIEQTVAAEPVDGQYAPVRWVQRVPGTALRVRSEEHTSELQSLMRISYAVFCLKKKNTKLKHKHSVTTEIQQ